MRALLFFVFLLCYFGICSLLLSFGFDLHTSVERARRRSPRRASSGATPGRRLSADAETAFNLRQTGCFHSCQALGVRLRLLELNAEISDGGLSYRQRVDPETSVVLIRGPRTSLSFPLLVSIPPAIPS